MNKLLDITFDETPWECLLNSLKSGESLPAMRFLTMMEGEEEEEIEQALQDLEQRQIMLDVSQLPRSGATGESAVRLRWEEQMVREQKLMQDLGANDPLRLYLQELAEVPVCGDPQVLAGECAAGLETAREQLLNLSLSRVVELAQQQVGRGVLLVDLIQEGSMGLWQGILHYTQGDWEVHRDWWIRSALAKTITMQARANGVGQKMRQALEDYRSVDERLLGELGRNPTREEMAEHLHMTLEETDLVARMMDNIRQLDRVKVAVQPPQEDPDDQQAVEDTAFFRLRQRISDLMSVLPEEDAKLLTLRFGLEGGLPLDPEQTGRQLGLTPQEVVEREAKALARMRQN